MAPGVCFIIARALAGVCDIRMGRGGEERPQETQEVDSNGMWAGVTVVEHSPLWGTAHAGLCGLQ